MKQIKLIVLIIIISLLGIFIVFYFSNRFQTREDQGSVGLEKMAQEFPEFIEFINDIKKWQVKLDKEEDEGKIIEARLGLGMAWKSLADRTKNEDHYRTALKIYQEGVEYTGGRNTIFLDNAGNVAVSLKDYSLAQDYYEKALKINPGDSKLYIRLAEFYEYNTDKTPDEIIALLDLGIGTAMRSVDLENYKRAYIERLGNNNETLSP